jgi:hypothetical protein
MRRRHFFSYAHRASREPEELISDIHEVIDRVMERAMDAAFKVTEYVPWSADEITRHVEDFVNKHVPDAERCVEDSWDDSR